MERPGDRVAVDPARLIGSWDLVSFETLVDGQVTSRPLGEGATGRIIYGTDGTVTALLSRAERIWPAGGEFVAVAPEVRAEAALGFVAYTGTFRVDGDRAIHSVTISLYPELIGTDLIRTITFEGDLLLLDTEPIITPSGRDRRQRLTWRPLVER